jgi:hypothetical protein
MQRCSAIRVSLAVVIISALALPASLHASKGTASAPSTPVSSSADILVGFVGGFVSHDNPHHGPVKLAKQLRPNLPHSTYIRVFENRHRRQAYVAILRRLDANHDGILSAEEKSGARIVLFGQSWGASAAVALARDLRRQNIPVLLTVQVDSVAKAWQNDSIIPDNVAQAINFYQPHGIIHGQSQIVAANPAKTQILGNYLIDYRKTPVDCPDATWADRFFTPGHMQSECDPHLWSQIETLVRNRLSSDQPTSIAKSLD